MAGETAASPGVLDLMAAARMEQAPFLPTEAVGFHPLPGVTQTAQI
ncbi:hypothetical protein N0A02_06320 [Paraburkholderia acidicola]|uniref:Uncharacterized protein n=1 Tax=Paraburkholderia acidicola TaxID=1912599 RepID=A0ABV1LIE8_9BURK|nr:hypothetical protein [Paraburkholderia acidicola]